MVDVIYLEGDEAARAKLAALPARAQVGADRVAREVAAVEAGRIRAGAGVAGRQASRAAASVHAQGAAIAGGGPFFMGSVFGGQGRPSTMQFRAYKARSYWFFTTLRDDVSDTFERFAGVVEDLARDWGRR